jgi:RNA polymerase sigma factor (sigma-70 family)
MMGAAARAVAESGDFLHDVFVELARGGAWQRCADQNSFLRHCTAIARNNVRDSVRRKREQRLHDFTCSTLRLVGADGKTPSELAEHREQTERVVDALAELAPLDREVIELRDFERLAYVDIGLRIGRSENATQLLHARALRRLSKLLCRA